MMHLARIKLKPRTDQKFNGGRNRGVYKGINLPEKLINKTKTTKTSRQWSFSQPFALLLTLLLSTWSSTILNSPRFIKPLEAMRWYAKTGATVTRAAGNAKKMAKLSLTARAARLICMIDLATITAWPTVWLQTVPNVTMGWYATTTALVARVAGNAKKMAKLSLTARTARLICRVVSATTPAWPTV